MAGASGLCNGNANEVSYYAQFYGALFELW
jgi:hypothetical protein